MRMLLLATLFLLQSCGELEMRSYVCPDQATTLVVDQESTTVLIVYMKKSKKKLTVLCTPQ